jgi:serine/threonine protein kinase
VIGRTLSHYKILEKLGEGGMGIVYKAQDLKLNRVVALKFLPSAQITSPTDIERFKNEANALSSLNHPNIATIFDIDEADGQRFIALELLPGGTLRSEVRRYQAASRDIPLNLVVTYAIQIADALNHAHKRNIVHRDVKTENMLLTEDGKVKITDFGLAKLRSVKDLTRSGSTLGTAAYMSPEQIRGEEIDGRSDIFSFGVVLYELTTGRLPFRGDHEAALSYSIVHEEPVAVNSLRSKVPQSLVDLISKCLTKEKENRYQSCEQITVELQKVSQEITGFVTSEVKEGPRKGIPGWVVLLAGLALVVVGVVLYILFAPAGKSKSARPSIAVLYVENLTGDSHYDSFSIGLTEEITSEISNIPGLLVTSRNDVAQYRGKPVDMHEIGEKLGVSYVLEGSMRVEGKRLRVTCQAIQTSDRFHFWSQGFTRDLTDALEVQTDVAQQVALGLKTKFAQKNVEEKLGLPQNSLLKQ